MKKILQHIMLISCFLGLGGSNLSSQILLKETSLEKQITNSSLVIEGKVLSKSSLWDAEHKNIYTVNTVEVYKVFKGEALETIEIITEGGTVGLSAQMVTPSLKLRTNDTGVFMLYDNNINIKQKSAKKQFKTYGSLQGFYKYNLTKDEAINPFNKKQGISSAFYGEIMAITKSDVVEVKNLSLESKQSAANKGLLAPGGITFSPSSISAGTKSVLTINGTGFGSAPGTLGKVSFSNADDGGATLISALSTQILSWGNTQITVEVPSDAGTGIIEVTDSAGASAISVAELTVTYAEINVVADDINPGTDVAYRTQHVNDNFSGGYTWRMFTGFDNNANAKAAFLRALDSWRCGTGINWVTGATTNTNVAASDGVNVVRFDVNNELDNDVLGQCSFYYSGCLVNRNSSINWYVYEFDIVFDDATVWNYSSDINSTEIGEYDFESVALHELGHGHQLGHVNNTNDVMHYAISTSEEQRVLGTGNIACATTIQTRSTTIVSCTGLEVMTNHPCYLSIEEEELTAAISLYPNPNKGIFNINNSSLISLEKVVIYDIRGRLMAKFDMTNASRIKTINLQGVSKGMYFVNIYSDKAMITKKIILE